MSTISPKRRVRLGIIVPSSNTVLEPLSQRMADDLNQDATIHVTVHFSRFRVTRIDLSPESISQFNPAPMIEAAKLLADAGVDAIAWGGVSAAWLGLAFDEDLCRRITEATGLYADSAMLSMRRLLGEQGSNSVGLVTPFHMDVNQAIRKTLDNEGWSIPPTRSRHAGLVKNLDIASVPDSKTEEMVDEVVRAGANTVLIVCTNVPAAPNAAALEDKYGIKVVDSVATTILGMLQHLGIRTRSLVRDWGTAFK